MNIFKNYTMSWWQVGLLKACLLLVGVTIGANWPAVFVGYTTWMLVVALALGIYLWVISFKQ